MKKNDFVLIGIVIVFAIVFYCFYSAFMGEGETLRISVDGIEYGVYDLNEDQIIYIGDTNVLEIKDGEAFMIEADCPDGLCLHQTSISQNKESIICLPNRVIAEVTSEGKSEYDAFSQ